MNKKVIIIGAGIAGLSAGCYLRMNGYDTEIFELHGLPGGLCTSWKRKGFTIDGCIHWLVGSSPSDDFYRLWHELIDMEKVDFIDSEEYMRFEDTVGNFIRVFADVDWLEKEMLEKAPEDGNIIRELTGAVRKLSRLNLPLDKPQELYTLMDGIRMVARVAPYMRALKKWSGISARDYAARCRSPLLAKTIESLFIPGMSVIFLIFTLIWMNRKSAGYPVGGSLAFAKLIEKSYLELGGLIRYKSRVREIIVTDDTAKGVILDNGESHQADIVLSAADGYNTIFEMLKGKYLNEKIVDFYKHYEVFPSYLQVSLGVSRIFDGGPGYHEFELDKPLYIDEGTSHKTMGFRIFSFDPTAAPKGKTLITVMLTTFNYKYWNNLRKNDLKKYRDEKKRVADGVISVFCKKYGVKKSAIVMTDVSTPATVIRYTNNWKGSFEGWIMSPKMGFKQMKKVLPGLNNFYMAGQWVEPGGGLPSAIMSGRNVTQLICAGNGKSFSVTVRQG